jgi:hypothetical protein
VGAAGKKRQKKWLPQANSGQNKMIHNNTDTINFIPSLLYHNPPPSDLLLPPPTAVICRRLLLIPTSATIRHSPLPSAAVFGRPPPSAVRHHLPPPSNYRQSSRESGNRNLSLFSLLKSLSVVNSGQ